MSLEALRKGVRPWMQVMLIGMIGPLAIICGALEVFLPGSGIRFANGALQWLRGLPSDFWLFAGAATATHTVSRTVDKRSESKAIEAYSASANKLREEQGEA